MIIKYPQNGRWIQANASERETVIDYAKNINLDEEGFLKLSPRSVNVYDDAEDTTNISDTDFDTPVAFGRTDEGNMLIATIDEPFDITLRPTLKDIGEDESSNNPNLTTTSHGVWWQKRFYESTSTAVSYNSSGTWTANVITSLTAGVRHYMAVFKSRQTLVVTNGNVLKQYQTNHASDTDLTIPSDFEIIGVAYNNNKVGIITRLGTDSQGQNAEAYFFWWDGRSTFANAGFAIGSYACVSIIPYKSSFVILTSSGRLLYFNGGGFDELARFPFYLTERRWGNLLNYFAYGDNMIVDGDVIYINLCFEFQGEGRLGEEFHVKNQSGVWCFDPKYGLYHRYSPSASRAYFHTIDQASVNTTTGIITTSSTIPNSGNPLIMTTNSLGGLSQGVVYYVAKITSTTFKIAETKEDAIAGNGMTISSASATNYLMLYDLKDYGVTQYTRSGAVALWDTTSTIYKDIIFGQRLLNTSLGNLNTLCTATPFLENRGYVVFPKLLLNEKITTITEVVIKHAPLKVNDAIILKVKEKEYVGLPVSSPNNYTSNELSWTSSTTATTGTDLSDAKTVFDAGEELELELTAGAGAGQMVKITNITENAGTYTITVEDEVLGASNGVKSYFVIDNWKVCGSVTYTTQKEGVATIPVKVSSKSPKVKVELRGDGTKLEDIFTSTKSSTPLDQVV